MGRKKQGNGTKRQSRGSKNQSLGDGVMEQILSNCFISFSLVLLVKL